MRMSSTVSSLSAAFLYSAAILADVPRGIWLTSSLVAGFPRNAMFLLLVFFCNVAVTRLSKGLKNK